MTNNFFNTRIFSLCAILLLSASFPAYAQIIKTIAGIGTTGFSGDGSAATAAQLNQPRDIVLDTAGNLFINDDWNSCIRKVGPAGIITTIAGTAPTAGYSGDGGPATAASLNGPSSMAIDKFGNVYIADFYNHRIRKVSTSGIITNFAGNGTTATSGDGGPATAAGLNLPWYIAFDTSGNLYIADAPNQCVRKVNTAGIITTFAGNGLVGYNGDGGPASNASLSSPTGLSTDKHGNVYIADLSNNVIRRVNPAGIISTFAGNGTVGFGGDGGPATSAAFKNAYRVSADNYGNVYITDNDNQRIRKVNGAGYISTVAGNGTSGFLGDGGQATVAELSTPFGVTTDKYGNLYIADSYNNRIRKIALPFANNPLVAGINETIKIYPNPNKSEFTIIIESDLNENMQVVITNILGEKVKTISITTNKPTDIRLDTPPGVYFLSATGDHGTWTAKMVVNQ